MICGDGDHGHGDGGTDDGTMTFCRLESTRYQAVQNDHDYLSFLECR